MSSGGVFVQLLGAVQIFKAGRPLAMRSGGKAEQLLSCLAMDARGGLHRETLIERIWPDTPMTQAGQCLTTLAHSLKAQLADALAGESPIVYAQGRYALNLPGGVAVDVLEFESAVTSGLVSLSGGSASAAIESFERAITLYRGDLAAGADIAGLLERERLRAACLTTLARLADAHFELENYERALESALRLLGVDPCREDAHRMVMRSHVRLGARAQALHQYRLCQQILRDEFDANPEPATARLFDLLRTAPDQV